jgi:Co/Zn/Cd efflux system component
LNKFSPHQSTVQLLERESPRPVEMLTAWLEDFDKDYVESTIGVKVEETMETTKAIQEVKQTLLELKMVDKVQDHQILNLEQQILHLEQKIMVKEETAQIQITQLRGEVARLSRL